MPLTCHGLLFDVVAEKASDGETLVRHGSDPRWPMQLVSRPLAGQSFEQAVQMERARSAGLLDNVKVMERTNMTLAGVATWFFVQAGQSPEGDTTWQFLALMHADEHLVTLLLTGDEETSEPMRACFEATLISFRRADEATSV